jgi:hypothetical protein
MIRSFVKRTITYKIKVQNAPQKDHEFEIDLTAVPRAHQSNHIYNKIVNHYRFLNGACRVIHMNPRARTALIADMEAA